VDKTIPKTVVALKNVFLFVELTPVR